MSEDVTERCYLYRFFDADGRLLYVGIARDLGLRLAAHHRRAEWWSCVASGTIETHPSRPAAEFAEAIAIHSEHPMHNASRPTEEKIVRLQERAAGASLDVTQLVAEVERLRALCAEQTIRLAKMRGHVDAAREAYRKMRAKRLQAETDRSTWARRYFELTDPRRVAARELLPQSPPADWGEL